MYWALVAHAFNPSTKGHRDEWIFVSLRTVYKKKKKLDELME